MTTKQARATALRDITALLGAANSYLRGIAPCFMANKYISEEDKLKIRKEWLKIEFGLVARLNKAEGR